MSAGLVGAEISHRLRGVCGDAVTAMSGRHFAGSSGGVGRRVHRERHRSGLPGRMHEHMRPAPQGQQGHGQPQQGQGKSTLFPLSHNESLAADGHCCRVMGQHS